MTFRSSYADIMRVLFEHGGPMTAEGLAAEVGCKRSSIERARNTLVEMKLVQVCEKKYRNPGTGRMAMLLEPGPLVQEWARRRDE